MSVKTWLIGAAAVVVLGGATVVVLGQKDGAQSGTKQTTAKSSADKTESANSNSTKSKDDKLTVIKPFEAAQSSKRQVWLWVYGKEDSYGVTKNSGVDGILVTQNGQATVYSIYDADGLFSDDVDEMGVSDFDNLSDDAIISKVKAANYRPVSFNLTAKLKTDDTGNEVASEELDAGDVVPFNIDMHTAGNFGTVLTHEYWGFSGTVYNDHNAFLVQPVKPGNNPVYSFDDITTKGVEVE